MGKKTVRLGKSQIAGAAGDEVYGMQPMLFDFGEAAVITEDERHIRYRMALPEGAGEIAVYPVMPGIEVALMEFQAPGFPSSHRHPGRDMLEINHCLEGRSECRMSDGCLQYIGENDLFLSTLRNHSDSVELPLGRYQGVNILIDPGQAAPEVERLLSDVSFRIAAIAERFFVGDECFLIPSNEAVDRLFGGIYGVPQGARALYYRLKILELLLYLHCFDPALVPQKPAYARQQVDTIKQVHRQLTENPGRRFTIEELAGQFCISATTLKTGFKGVYGTPINAYMKEYRIRRAGELLRGTSKSVAEISAEMGYASQGKFGAAFKERMNINPLEYRKQYQDQSKS